MREAVRSGRRANFYITENSFIDHYAREVGTTGVAVYHVLERHANCDTRSTWIGTAKMAKLLNVDQRTIQRTIKKLESLRLIRIVRSENMTTFFIVPVPPPARTTSAPLFDEMPDSVLDDNADDDDMDVASATSESRVTTFASHTATSRSRSATFTPHPGDIPVGAYKEEQNLSNKTLEQGASPAQESAQRILAIFRLPAKLLHSVLDVVEAEVRHTGLSMEGSVARITTAANLEERRGIPIEKFLDNFLARIFAEEIVGFLHLPATNNLIFTVAESVKAETKQSGSSAKEAAKRIAAAASEDRRKGTSINKFYFEDMKWRDGNGSGRSKSTAERNLDAALDARTAARRAVGLDH